MDKFIIDSKVFLNLLDNATQYRFIIKDRTLRIGVSGRIIGIEATGEMDFILDIAQGNRAILLLRAIEQQPLTVRYDEHNSCILINVVII